MARPTKQGIDYFPLDVQMDIDTKIAFIEVEYGIEGFGIIIKLLMRIYGLQGYYISMGEREQKLFSKQIGANIETLSKVILLAIKEGLFNKDIFNKYSILTSKGIQVRYIEACARRKDISILKELLLIDIASNDVNVSNNSINVSINEGYCKENDTISTQSKVNKNKVNNTKEKNSNESEFDTILNEYEYLKTTLYEFIKMRKAIKKPCTPHALKLIIKDLFKLSSIEDEQILILEQSIANSYQGVFPLNKSKDKGFNNKPVDEKNLPTYLKDYNQ